VVAGIVDMGAVGVVIDISLAHLCSDDRVRRQVRFDELENIEIDRPRSGDGNGPV
jgi:hypothetical protein